MDSLSELLPFLIAAGYLALKFRRRPDRDRVAPVQQKQVRPPSVNTTGPTPFEQLLARLEEQATGAPPAAPSATRVPDAKREFTRPEPPVRSPTAQRPDNEMYAENRAAFARDKARTQEATAFRSLEGQQADASRGFQTESGGFDHDRHGFGDDNPLSEVAFSRTSFADQRPANANRTANRPGYDPHGLAPAPTPAPAPRFGSPAAIREAFVLSTILSRRPPLRRPSPPTDTPTRDAGA